MDTFSRIRLITEAQNFRLHGTFTDIVARSGGKEMAAHRLILAKFSKWFYEYFKNSPMPKPTAKDCHPPLVIDLPENPDNCFETFLDLIYIGNISIPIEKLPPLLNIATFYRMDLIAVVIRQCLMDAISEKSVFKICKQLVSLGLIDDAIRITPFLANLMVKMYTTSEIENTIHKEDFFESACDGRVFAKILKEQVLTEPSQEAIEAYRDEKARLREINGKLPRPREQDNPFFLTEDQKVELIDMFTSTRPVLRTEERDALASVIQWGQKNAHLHVVRHRCDWLPASLHRRLLVNILKHRRSTINAFKKDSANTNEQVSRWFPFSWLQAIKDNIEVKIRPEYDIIRFISTLGGSANPLNPNDFSLVDTEFKGKLLHPDYAPRFALENSQNYFAGYAIGASMPSFSVLFSGTPISANYALCDLGIKQKKITIVDKKQHQDKKRMALENDTINTEEFLNPEALKIYRKSPEVIILRTLNDNGKMEEFCASPGPEGKVRFELGGIKTGSVILTCLADSKRPITILRVRSLEIHGSFLPQ